jgi:TetR/AcrR family transcriptional repressor of nem operon
MMREYRERAACDLARIDAAKSRDRQRLKCYIKELSEMCKNGERLCPWAMLATDFNTLPEQIRVEVRAFYRLNESWLEQRLEAGRQVGDFTFPGSARVAAETCFAMLEGALLSARVIGDNSRLARVYGWMETLMATK